MWSDVASRIAQTIGSRFMVERQYSVGGGCINNACVLEGTGQRYFVKHNTAGRLAMFEAEMAGLREIAQARVVRVPAPVCCGLADGRAFLVLEYVEFGDNRADAMALLGEQLAALHRLPRQHFGWTRDNTLGLTPQHNTPNSDWLAFWREHRLGFQLTLAQERGASHRLFDKGERLSADASVFFQGYAPRPSLLHGDLWSGNADTDMEGRPVLFDPAVYYGDREADIAMTELFGGFSPRFYQAYRDAFPLDPGYRARKTFYNLYHVLNHFNLFGGGYGPQAEQMIDSLLSELR